MSGEQLRKKQRVKTTCGGSDVRKIGSQLAVMLFWIVRCSLAGGQMPLGGFKARFPAQSLLLLPFVVQVVSAQLGVPTTRLSLHHHGP